MKTILIIDDSEALRVQLRRVLESVPYLVVEACSGIEALAFVKKNSKIDLIICDQNMPEMDGIAFAKRVQEEHPDFSIPLVLLTAEMSGEIKKKSKEVGIKVWIMKPFVKENLLLGLDHILKDKK